LNNNYIKFWGVRGSRPTAETDKLKYGGDTSCVEIRTSNNELVILDMGTGLSNIGRMILEDTNSPKVINIFLSHYHWDHLLGFLNFTPLFNDTFTFNIYGNNKQTNIKIISRKLLDKTFWPVSLDMLKAKINFIDLKDETIRINNNLIIENMEHIHPNGATSYKVSIDKYKIVYSTDCEHPGNKLNSDIINFAKNADILIHDSHFTNEDLITHQGWGHSSWEQATNVASKANVRKLILFHFCPNYTDEVINNIEKNAQGAFKSTIAAKQGLKIQF